MIFFCRCRLRVLDSFGSHAEFNLQPYFLRNKERLGGKKKNAWGGHHTVQRLTAGNDPPKGLRFSHLYGVRGEPTQDSKRMRRRLASLIGALREHISTNERKRNWGLPPPGRRRPLGQTYWPNGTLKTS